MLARTEQQHEVRRDGGLGRGLSPAQDSLLSALLESAPECVIVMDGEGMVVELNPAAEHIFGYRREEMLGRELAGLVIPPSLRARHRQALRRCREGEAGSIVNRRVELTGMHADGSEFPVELTVARVAEKPALYAGFL